LLASEKYLAKDPVAAAYFYDPDGKPWPVGHVLKNPELAAVLRAIAANGSKALLEGEVAQAIVDKVQKHPTNPGKLSLSDLAGYQPRKRTPICHDYSATGRDYRICGFPPPSSGAIAVGQILGILSNTQAASLPLHAGVHARRPHAVCRLAAICTPRLHDWPSPTAPCIWPIPDFVQPLRRQLDEPDRSGLPRRDAPEADRPDAGCAER
jgi:gamma-glutamyltranspeptidase